MLCTCKQNISVAIIVVHVYQSIFVIQLANTRSISTHFIGWFIAEYRIIATWHTRKFALINGTLYGSDTRSFEKFSFVTHAIR